MKLLIVTTVPQTLEAFLLPYAEHFRREGWVVEALANGAADSEVVQESFDSAYNIEWSRNPVATLRKLHTLAAEVRSIVREGAHDIVHVHTPVAAFVTRYALRDIRRALDVRVVYTAHGFHFYSGGNPLRNAVFLGVEKLAGRWTDDLVLINQEDVQQASRYSIVPSDRVHHMPGIGVNIDEYVERARKSDGGEMVRRELGLTPEDHLVLMVAEFNERKRHKDAISAVAACSVERLHLAFAGNGALVEDMKQYADECGVADRVHFLGFRGDVPSLLAASDACLLPSEQEGLPRCVMEAMAVGVPVVGTDIRGMQDLLQGGAGLLVPVGAPEEIARALERLLSDPEEASRIKEAGLVRISQYDVSQVILLHEQLYGLGSATPNSA